MLHMKDTIRDRRHALGLTQQQMAERLGVSAAAVSKWEMGASYPDVMLLPALARLLGVDLNALMGFEREPDRSEIAAMLAAIRDLAVEKGMDNAMDRAEEVLREYPSCGALLFGAAATLEGCMMMAGLSPEEKQPYAPRILAWYRRAADSADAEASEAAAHLLAAKHLAWGEADQAEQMMKRLPKEPDTPRWPLDVSLLLAKDEREQAKVLLKNTLFRRAGDMQQLLLRLEQMELDEGNLAHAQSLADLTQSFVSLLCMHPYVGHLAQLMPALKRQDEAESLKHIRAMLEALESPWSPGECLPYAHSGVKKGGHVTMSAGIIREMQESEEYAFLRGNKAFIALLADHTPGGCHPSSHSASQTP